MEAFMYNTTPTSRARHVRFSGSQASFSPGLAGTASGDIEAFIWRCKQDDERNTRYKCASRELDSSSVTTFINMLTEVNTRCRKLEDQLLHLQEHTRRVTSQLDSIVSHHGDKPPTFSPHPSTSSIDTMKAIRKLQWKIFDLQRENEALRGVLEVQRVKVEAEGEVATPPRPPEADHATKPWFNSDKEEASTPHDESEGSAFLRLGSSLASDLQRPDPKSEHGDTSKEAHPRSTPLSDQREVQQRANSDQQNPQLTPSSFDQRGIQQSDQKKIQSTPRPSSSADRRIVVEQQFNSNINRNPQPIFSNFQAVDEGPAHQIVISDDAKLVHNVEHPHIQKNSCGGVKFFEEKSPGATSTPASSSYRPMSSKWTQSGKKKYHFSRPPVCREEWRWSSPSTSYPQVSHKSSTVPENPQGIQSCYQSTPKSYYGDPHTLRGSAFARNVPSSKEYGCSNPDKVESSGCGGTPFPDELGDLELGEFNLYASPEDIRLVQGTLELLSTIDNMGYIHQDAK